MTSRSGLRMALDARIINTAGLRGVPPNRMRRHMVFQRMLCRFGAEGAWVLKGGFCLEVRFELAVAGDQGP